MIKMCIDCKHVIKNENEELKCGRNALRDLVDGSPKSCWFLRYSTYARCGSEGYYWEENIKKDQTIICTEMIYGECNDELCQRVQYALEHLKGEKVDVKIKLMAPI